MTTPLHCVAPIDFAPFPKEHLNLSIAHGFEKQAEAHPEHLAIKTAAGSVTYRELNRMANRIAHAIIGSFRNRSLPVALVPGRDPLTLAAILAVLKAGRILVPLDLERPRNFTQKMLEDAGARLILSNQESVSAAMELAPQGVTVLNIDELQSGLPHEDPALAIVPEAIAWILYTSGTTGAPKGVMQTHRDELHNVMTITNSHYFSPADRMTLLRNPSVGGAIRNLFSALLNGASLFPYEVKKSGIDRLASWLIREEITVYHSSASLFRSLVQQLGDSERFSKLRLIRLGSEPVSWADVEAFRKHASANCAVVNALSSTEARTYLQYFVDTRLDAQSGVLPVGYPVDDVEVLILDDQDRLVQAGEIGEMALRSPYIFPGYWQRGEQAPDGNVADPDRSGERLLRTGDLGRMRPDGCFEHHGRKDLVCKIRGHRVQIDAVEAVLRRIPEVKAAVVAAQPWRGETRLVAYVVPQGKSGFSTADCRRVLQDRLPEFMIPALFVSLDELPMTPSGKVDRQALAVVPRNVRPKLTSVLVAPNNAVERVLMELWANALDIEAIGIEDNFLELGGHSLMAGEIIAQINRIFAVELRPQELLQAGTIANLAGVLRSRTADPGDAEKIACLWSTIERMDSAQIREGLRRERARSDNVR